MTAEQPAAVAAEVSADADATDLFAGAVAIAPEAEESSVGTASTAPALAPAAQTTSVSSTASARSLAVSPMALAPVVEAPVLASHLSITTLPNGPPSPAADSTTQPGSLTTTAAEALSLASLFTTGLASLDAQLPAWGSFFNLGSIDFAAQGLPPLNLPVIPSTLNSLFDLGSLLGAVNLPSFATAETQAAFVGQLLAEHFTITSIEGGFSNGTTTIAASTGTTLLEGTFTLAIATGFNTATGYLGTTYNGDTGSVLAGLSESRAIDGSLTFTGDLSLTLNFVLDSAAGLQLLGSSALTLTVTGNGSLTGTAKIGGAAEIPVTGMANASLIIALGFHDPAARYTPAQIGATTLAPVATGNAALSLAFTTGPASFTFGASYTVTSNLATRVVTQTPLLTLTGVANLPGITDASGANGTISLSGVYNIATDVWTITAATSPGLKMLGQTLEQLSLTTTLTPTTFDGEFTAKLRIDALREGQSPVMVDVSAAYDRTTVTVTATGSIAALNVSGTNGNRLLALTDATIGGTFNGVVATGVLTGSLTISATSGTFQPDAAADFTATISDGVADADPYAVVGTYDFVSEVFALAVDQFSLLAAGVFSAAGAGFSITYDRTKADQAQVIAELASVEVKLLSLQQAGSTEPPVVTVSTFTLRQNGFGFSNATATIGNTRIGNILTLDNLVVTLDGVSYTTGSTPVGVIGFSAPTGTLFPDASATASLTTIGGSFNVGSAAFALSIGTVQGAVGTTLVFSGAGLAFTYKPTGPPTQSLISADSLTAALPSGNVSGELKGLQITAEGDFSAVRLQLDPSGLPETLGLGEFLPFKITSIDAKFHGDTNGNGVRDTGETFLLTAFDLTVTGVFDFAKLKNLPFTPIIRIGTAAGTQQFTEAGNLSFTFTVTVTAAGVKPKDIGPIEIGFSDLKVGGTVTLGGTITLGGYQNSVFVPQFGGTFSLVSNDKVKDVNTTVNAVLVGTFDTSAHTIDGSGSITVNFSYGTYVTVEGATLNFAFSFKADSGFSIDVTRLTLTSGTVDTVQVKFGTLMVFTARGATFNFNATDKQAFATFDLMSVKFPSVLNLTGTATHFGFAADGSLIALTGFAAWISIDSISLKWPSWLPLRIDLIGLSWPDFNLDPLNFVIILSATVQSINGLTGLTVEGTIQNAIIDLRLLAEGKFPLVGLGLVAVSVSGNAFGGHISGTLALGLIRLDAAGRQIGGTDYTTPVSQRVLYGAIEAGFTFASMSGFNLRLGLSELGPLQAYLSVSGTQILDASSGLAIKDFRAGVLFNTELPAINEPLALKNSVFTPAAQMTLAEWLIALEAAVVSQARAPPSGNFWNAFSQTMRIEGGATLFSAYASENSFRADVDIIFDTKGKVVINARGTFANNFSFNFRLYTDLTKISTDPTFLFLSEQPQNPTTLTLRGRVQFKFLQADGTPASATAQAAGFSLKLIGGMDVKLTDLGTVTVDGTISLSFTTTRAALDYDGTLKVGLIGDLARSTGRFVFERVGSGIELWGVGQVQPVFNQLESLGLFVSGSAWLGINTSDQMKGESGYLLKPRWFAITVPDGALQVKQDGVNLFRVEGGVRFEVTTYGLDLTIRGNLLIGPSSAPIVTFKVDGYLAVRSNGVAGRIDLALEGKVGGAASKLEFTATYQLVFNTTGQTISYLLPLTVGSVGGSRTVEISGTAPGAKTAGPYFFIEIHGSLSLDGTFSLTDGTFRLTVTSTTVRLEVSAKFQLTVSGTRLLGFDVSGGFELATDGVAAALVLTVRAGEGVPTGHGWSITGTFRLLYSTRNSEVVLDDSVVSAGAKSVHVSGSISVGGFSINGVFSIYYWGDTVEISALGWLPITAADTTVFILRVRGVLQVSNSGLATVLAVSVIPGKEIPTSHNWSLAATYRLDLNTRGSEFSMAGVTVPGHTVRIFIDGTLKAEGFELKGRFLLTASREGMSLEVAAAAKLLHVSFWVGGAIGIYTDGIAFKLAVSLPHLNAGTFSIGGDFSFAVNTSASTRLQIAPRSGYLAANTSVSLAGVTVAGGIRISSTGRVEVPSDSPLTATVLGQHATFWGYIDFGKGTFNLTGRINIHVGNSIAGVSGTLDLQLYRIVIKGVEASGFAGTINATLSGFGIHLATLSGSVSLGTHITLAVQTSFTLWDFVKIDGTVSVSIDPHRVRLTFDGNFDIFGRFKAAISGAADSKVGEWALTGSASASFGGSWLGASVSVKVALGSGTYTAGGLRFAYTPGVTVSGSAWAKVGVKGYTIGIDGSFSTSLTGESLKVHVSGSINVLIGKIRASRDVHINFRTGSIWLSDVGGSTVFFDANLNGLHDPGEPSTTADDLGSFSFEPVAASTPTTPSTPENYNHLGRLLPFDTNGNGIIDSTEGTFVLTGGSAVVDGTTNTSTVLLGISEGHAGFREATVFLDLNGNQQLDPGEHFTATDRDGFYTFDEAHDFVEIGALGLLAPFDLNHNGVIDGDEGLLRVTGGRLFTGTPEGITVGAAYTGTADIAPLVTGATFVAQGEVFLDVNGNGRLDTGEPHVTTGFDGSYSFDPHTIAARVAALGRLGGADRNQNGVIDAGEGRLVAVGGTRIGVAPASGQPDHDPDALLHANGSSGMINWSGATVFLDQNGNGTLDAGEISTTSDAHGFYTFLHATQFKNELGALKAYDLNGNGVLDPTEGVFVIHGGVDLHTGLVNQRTLSVLATNYGSIFGTQISPLSELYTYLVLAGLSVNDANSVMHHAFGLPQTVDMLTFDPDEFTNLEDEGEIAAKLISFLAFAGAEIVESLGEVRSGSGHAAFTHGQAEDFVIHALANYVRRLEAPADIAVDASGNLVGGTPTLKLDDPAVARAVLTEAVSRAGLALPPTAQLDAAIAALDQFLDYIVALREANVSDITGALARLSGALHVAFHQSLDDLFDGRVSITDFNQRFTAEGVRKLVRSVEIPKANAPATLSVTDTSDATRADFTTGAPMIVPVRVADADNLPSDVELLVRSSNPDLVPVSAITVLGTGANRSLVVTPVLGRTGTATITLQVSDGQTDGGPAAIQQFTVTVVYTYASFMNDLAIRSRHEAADAAARDERGTDNDVAGAVNGGWLAELMDDRASEAVLTVAPASVSQLVAETSLRALETPRTISGL